MANSVFLSAVVTRADASAGPVTSVRGFRVM